MQCTYQRERPSMHRTEEHAAESLGCILPRLLARYGYRKMTIDDVAREVGIGKGTIYLHFKSKEDVALSRIDRVIVA